MITLLLAAVTISADPARVQLGETARVRLRIEAPSQPRLSASAGRIEGLRAEGGRWIADYLPPDSSLPQMALISALAGDEVGFLGLPLWGEGDAVVRTRPGGRIEVRIGQERFGPAIADARGIAVVPVDVPPGVFAAMHGKQSIDLHVPATRTVHLALAREQALADREDHVPVLLFAVSAQGAPRTDAQFVLQATRGAVGAPRPRGPGVYEADWKLPAAAPGPASLSAELRDVPGLRAQTSLQIVAGAAASLKLSADRERLVAGEGGFTVRAIAIDAAGNASAEPLRFETSLGTVRADGDSVRVEVPGSFGGASELRLTARPQSRAEPVAQLVLPLAAAEPASARLEVPPAPLHADGVSSLRLRLLLEDRFGNPVTDAQPVVTAESGSVAGTAPAGGGTYVATYVPPYSAERTQTVVAVSAGPAHALAHLDLLPRIHRLALSPRAGVLTDFSGFTSPVAGLEAAFRSDLLGPELVVSADLSYALQNAGGSSAGISARQHTDWLLAAAALAWRLRLAPGARAWIGAGPTLTALFTRTQLAGAPAQTGRALLAGVHLTAGLERAMWRGVPFAELRASIATDPGLPTLRGSLRSFTFSLGYRFELL